MKNKRRQFIHRGSSLCAMERRQTMTTNRFQVMEMTAEESNWVISRNTEIGYIICLKISTLKLSY